MKFQDTKFWTTYHQYDKMVKGSSCRCTVDAVMYWKLLTHFQFNQAIEIGTYQGQTSGLILESNPACELIGVDLIDHMDLFRKNYTEYQDRFTFLNIPSQQIQLTDEKFDFVMIDTLWDYESIKSDLQMFLPRLRKSGVVSFSMVKPKHTSADIVRAFNELHDNDHGWVPFLRTPQTEFWHHANYDRSDFLDSLFTDPISNFILIENQVDKFENTVCVAKSISMLTDHPEYFDLALKHYNI
jgi:predicted O-methyltransferase YrrM